MSHLVIGTAGHIDHGKSSLVQALTGIDPDRLAEEKRRGITIDLGFAHWVDGDRTFAFVDVPGHERFVRNMLAGIGGIDAVLLVIAADRSVMPQTREHFDICRLLGVPRGLVVITKRDLVDDDVVELAALEAGDLVRGSFLNGAPIVPVSTRTGAGLDVLRVELRRLANATASRDARGAARLPIDRVFTMTGFGTVVTGTLVDGSIGINDALDVVPAGMTATVRTLQVHGVAAERAHAGQRVAVNVADIDVDSLSRGQVLSAPGTLRATRVAEAWVDVLPGHALRHGARVRFHHGTAEVLGRVSVVGPETEAGEPPSVAGGDDGPVRLRLERAVAIRRGDRFVLRAVSPLATIGGGVVLDSGAARGAVRSLASLDRLRQLHMRPLVTGLADLAAHALLVSEAGGIGLPEQDLIWRAGVAPADLQAAVLALEQGGHAVAVAGILVAPPILERGSRLVLTALAAHHEAQPLSDGLSRQEIRQGVLDGTAAGVADLVLSRLEAAGQIVGRDRVALAARRSVLSDEAAQVRDRIEATLLQARLAPPDVERLTALPGVPRTLVTSVVQMMIRQDAIVSLGGMLFHRDVLRTLRSEVAALKASGGDAWVDVASFKSRYGLSRKFAIPLLEYLDRERVTRRVGERRIVL